MPKPRDAVLALTAVALLVLLVLPLVPYTVSFRDPFNYNLQIYSGCIPLLNKNSSAFQSCAQSALLPPSTVTGHASLLYRLFGFTTGPFPPAMFAQQGNQSYLLHFEGASISFVERPPFSQGGLPPDLNPAGVIRVDNVSIAQWAFGQLNFSASVTNIGDRKLSHVGFGFNYPTYGLNSSFGPLRVYYPPGATCGYALDPGATCTGWLLLPESSTLLTNQVYPMTLEVSGGYPAGSPARGFVYLETVPIRYPGVGLNSHWVAAFIQAINQRRGGAPLVEDRTLDEFAAFRYNTLRLQFQISDYNFTNDFNKFFGNAKPTVFEEILYPAGRDPATYPDYLQKNAIGHYTALVSPAYAKFGYFFGTGPAVEVGPGCTATEVPGPNINITQFAISHGCSYVIADEIWFIIILGG